jgi:hypothetical protein
MLGLIGDDNDARRIMLALMRIDLLGFEKVVEEMNARGWTTPDQLRRQLLERYGSDVRRLHAGLLGGY